MRQVIQYADAMETSPFPRLFVLDFLSDEEKASLITAEQPTNPVSNPVHQCPLAAGETADAASVETATCAEVVLTLLLLILECQIIDFVA